MIMANGTYVIICDTDVQQPLHLKYVMSLLVFLTVNLRPRYDFDLIYRSTEWTTVTCRHKPTLIDGEFYMSIENMVKYMECLTICNLIPEQDKLNTEQRSSKYFVIL